MRATTLLILQVSRVRSCYVRLRRRACDCRGAGSTMRVVPQSMCSRFATPLSVQKEIPLP